VRARRGREREIHFLSDLDTFAFLFVLGIDSLLFLPDEFGLGEE
jgi:hypothetical protein